VNIVAVKEDKIKEETVALWENLVESIKKHTAATAIVKERK
jgi:hypothetical protein